MSNMIKNRFIAMGLEAWMFWVRLSRFVRSIGRPRLEGLDHVTIPVVDLDVATRFYCDVLGATYFMRVDDETFKKYGRPIAPDGGNGAHHVSLFLGGSTRVDLFKQRDGQAARDAGHPHYAFRVSPGAMKKWKRMLESHGVPIEGPLQLGPPGQASLYFNDPSGNHLEIVTLGYAHEIPVRAPDMRALEWPS
jgi:catechol 2,3-dioxygenase-like lactoylglutathione lyase family enzyme